MAVGDSTIQLIRDLLKERADEDERLQEALTKLEERVNEMDKMVAIHKVSGNGARQNGQTHKILNPQNLQLLMLAILVKLVGLGELGLI